MPQPANDIDALLRSLGIAREPAAAPAPSKAPAPAAKAAVAEPPPAPPAPTAPQRRTPAAPAEVESRKPRHRDPAPPAKQPAAAPPPPVAAPARPAAAPPPRRSAAQAKRPAPEPVPEPAPVEPLDDLLEPLPEPAPVSLEEDVRPQPARTAREKPAPVPAPRPAAPRASHAAPEAVEAFVPPAPKSLDDAGLQESDVLALVLKYLHYRREETGFKISQHLGLRLPVIEPLLRQMKAERLVVYKGASTGGDYVYELTDLGRERARGLVEICTYFGTAPVPLHQYIAGVEAQSLDHRRPSIERIRAAFTDLTMDERLISSVGQAVHAGRGMFLFGNAGNGKTSIAQRITRAFGDTIWIPRALITSGEIIRVYDPNKHVAVAVDAAVQKNVDGRWVHIERPTIVAGGELRMDQLEISYMRGAGIGEAPLQLKANCGTLLIDDFGRQRMAVDELLNRWIVPLEMRHDFLYLESGRTIQVPFDELIVFSTNLEPRDLVEEAFLRRIPYKIEVKDPAEEQFRDLFLQLSAAMGLACTPDAVEYVLDTHYRQTGRGMRFCHPRDLLRQIQHRATLHDLPTEVTPEGLDAAVENYFSVM